MFDTLPGQVAYVKSGKLRGLGITSLKRSPLLPEVPTVAESGVPGFEVTVWYGVCAPTATPQPILTKLNADIIKALNMPDLRQRLADNGVDAAPMSREEFAAFISSEMKKWAKVIKDAGIQPE
jgi:tripartite-type tricarboxylate transporter receptor subunit TctC